MRTYKVILEVFMDRNAKINTSNCYKRIDLGVSDEYLGTPNFTSSQKSKFLKGFSDVDVCKFANIIII